VFVCCVCNGLCYSLITRSEESCRVCKYVWVFNCVRSRNHKNDNINIFILLLKHNADVSPANSNNEATYARFGLLRNRKKTACI